MSRKPYDHPDNIRKDGSYRYSPEAWEKLQEISEQREEDEYSATAVRSQIALLRRDMAHAGRLALVVVVSTNTGETGTERTYDIPQVKQKHSAMAISCHSGASPAAVVGATCHQGQVKVKFDIDPSTDHKISIWVACPDKHF